MDRIGIIDNIVFKDIHNFLCKFIRGADVESMKFLEDNFFVKNLIKKELDLGLMYPKEKEYQTLFYNLEYTFFSDIEDSYGYRENDVTLGLVVDYYSDNEFFISRDIVSKYGDIDYDKSEKLTSLSVKKMDEIKAMSNDFIRTLDHFIASASPTVS